MRSLLFATLCLTLFLTTACQEEPPQVVKSPSQSTHDGKDGTKGTSDQETAAEEEQASEGQPEQPGDLEQKPPEPPIFEDFQGDPQLSLFPRAGDFRPTEDSDRLPYWKTFIEHLLKVTGVAEEQETGSRAWVFRSIKSIDSLGYFSPLAVEPQTTYQVSFQLTAELSEGASAGIGILEFNKFLWVPGQYTEETFKQHFSGSHEGKRLTGTNKAEQTFTFTTGPETRMIHLVLFREGTHDRNSVMFDDIRIERVKGEG
jgi:hypothetical protein